MEGNIGVLSVICDNTSKGSLNTLQLVQTDENQRLEIFALWT